VTREVDGRTIIVCDHCRASLDLGRSAAHARRSPTGWRETGENQHLCTLCSPGYTASFIRRFG
jgi:hypothetical protein